MLWGRGTETHALRRSIDAARAGRGAVALVTGEPGIGRSALLAAAVHEHAAGTLVLRAAGVAAEATLPFAAVHRLLRPVADRIDRLPEPQRAALRAVFGLDRAALDPYLVSLATLTVLSDVAADQPVLVVIDDAHALDPCSADVLAFVARRLDAERIAMIIALDAATRTRFDGLTEIRLAPLAGEYARALVGQECGDAAADVVDRLLAEAAGNPLALVELCRALSAHQRHGVEPIPEYPPLPDRVTTALSRRVDRLPADARAFVLLAAAEYTGDLGVVLAAARAAGLPPDALGTALTAGLLAATDNQLRFRPPLLRSVVYHGSPLADRQRAHEAVVGVLAHADPRRVWHRAACAWRTDDTLADELAGVAARHRAAGRLPAATAALERAAQLTDDHDRRAHYVVAAAECAWQSGHPPRVRTLLGLVGPVTHQPELAARTAYLHGVAALADGAPAESYQLLVAAARPIRASHPGLAADLLTAAARAAWLGNDRPALATARDQTPQPPEPGPEPPTALVWPPEFTDRTLPPLVAADIEAGRWAAAEESATVALRHAAREQAGTACLLRALLAWLAAMRGDTQRCRDLAAAALEVGTPRRIALATAVAHRALGLLALGDGKIGQAIRHLRTAVDDHGPCGHPAVALAGLPDLVEAVMRQGDTAAARRLRERYQRIADGSGAAVHQALALRCQAVVADDEHMAGLFAATLTGSALPPFDTARTWLLYGSRLRRLRRVRDAREHLHTALTGFETLGARLWAQRSRSELRAAGDAAGGELVAAEPDVLAELTPRELQIVLSAAEGMTNRQIAAELYVSPRTVSDHLYKLFPKLGISSRHQLRDLRDLRAGTHDSR